MEMPCLCGSCLHGCLEPEGLCLRALCLLDPGVPEDRGAGCSSPVLQWRVESTFWAHPDFPIETCQRFLPHREQFEDCRAIKANGLIFLFSLQLTDRLLYSGSADRTVKCWLADTGERVRTFPAHRHSVSALKYHEGTCK